MSTTNRITVTTPTQPTVTVNDSGGVDINVAFQNSTGGGGSGDVVGPSSSTDNAIARYDGTTGKLIQDSGITIADGASGTLSGTNSGDVTLGTANGLSLAGQALSLAAASGSTTGALTSADWTTFNAKQSALTLGNLTSPTTGVSVTGGTGAVVGSGAAVTIQTASGSQPGLLSAADWTTFNSKQAAGSYITALTGDVTASGPGSVTATLANTSVTPGSYTLANITVDAKGRVTAAANGTASGGTVTSVSVTTANGVSGTVANATTTPAISLNLGAITPSSVAAAGTVTGSNLSGTNTGDVTLGASVTDVLSLSGQTLSGVDQGSDKLVFWDESANKLTSLTVGSGLSITGTTLSASSLSAIADWQATEGVAGAIGSGVRAWANGWMALRQDTASKQPTHVAAFSTGHGISFDGSNDLMTMTNYFKASTGTLICIFKTGTIGAKQVLCASSHSTSPSEWFEVGITAEGRIYIERNSAGTVSRVVGSTILTASTEYSMLLSTDGIDYYLMLNDVEENPLVVESVGSYGWFGDALNGDVFSIGATVTNSSETRFFSGIIGVLQIYSTDITH